MIFDYTIEIVGCIKTLNVCYHVFGFAGYYTMKPETANRSVVKLRQTLMTDKGQFWQTVSFTVVKRHVQ